MRESWPIFQTDALILENSSHDISFKTILSTRYKIFDEANKVTFSWPWTKLTIAIQLPKKFCKSDFTEKYVKKKLYDIKKRNQEL